MLRLPPVAFPPARGLPDPPAALEGPETHELIHRQGGQCRCALHAVTVRWPRAPAMPVSGGTSAPALAVGRRLQNRWPGTLTLEEAWPPPPTQWDMGGVVYRIDLSGIRRR